MVSLPLEPMPVLGGVDLQLGQNRILERSDISIVSVATPHGGEASLSGAMKDFAALDIPAPGRSTVNGSTRAIWTGPDQIFLVLQRADAGADGKVRDGLKGTGYTTDQTDVWAALQISGPDTISALERLCPLDLDLATFPVNAAARTVMEHMGAFIVRIAEQEFLLLSPSSSAASFLHAVELSYRYVT